MSAPGPQPLLGRDRELAELHAALGSAESGKGSLVLLVGEPGIGKTRLANDFASEAGSRGLLAECLHDIGRSDDLGERGQRVEAKSLVIPEAATALVRCTCDGGKLDQLSTAKDVLGVAAVRPNALPFQGIERSELGRLPEETPTR